jgi:signal transduction histidine kinase
MIAVFSAASLYAVSALQRQIDYDAVVDIAARLELTAGQMQMQAINYKENAPRDYETYYRDVRLYFQDLTAQIALFDAVVEGFMSGDLSDVLGGPTQRVRIGAQPALQEAVTDLKRAWESHRRGITLALGEDTEEPRLEWAAEYNLDRLPVLEAATTTLTRQLRQWAKAEHQRISLLAVALIAATTLVALGALALLHYRTLRPLRRTIGAFARVADGDFGHAVPVVGSSEIRELSARFNALSARLDLLFQLIDRLQRGDDLDEVVGFLGREFRELLRFDWIAVVLVNPHGATVRVEASSLDGAKEPANGRPFRLPDSLLQHALAGGAPMHIPDMTETAAAHPRYELLRDMVRRGLNDAVFLPVAAQSPTPGVVVFATRAASQYDPAHLRFLTNIAQLITESFGRTVRLAERRRLAGIGEYASAIAHELRSPLATLTLALDYFDRQPQPDGARKRLDLALTEAARMGRLIDDMLLYAKPLQLDLAPVDLREILAEAAALMQGQSACADRVIDIPLRGEPVQVFGDRDRLLQVVTNLLRNACESSPAGGRVEIEIQGSTPATQWLVEVRNGGDSVPKEVLARVFEPFVSTKRGGTGLGLAIVRRLVQMHGGDVRMDSSEERGTRVRVSLPALEAMPEQPPLDAAEPRLGASQ